jgi:hypothetical protein
LAPLLLIDEKNTSIVNTLKKKAEEYLTRATAIKKHLKSMDPPQPVTAGDTDKAPTPGGKGKS